MSTTPQATSTPKACPVPRCQYIKTNGVQCGSPALRAERHCFFHHQHRRRAHQFNLYEPEKSALNLPALEDANSIQVVLTEVIRLILTRYIDSKSASLLLRALRLAAANVKFTNLEPRQKTHIVIDPDSVEHRPLGATAWSETEGQAYDNSNDDNDNENARIVPETEPVLTPRHKSSTANRPSRRNSNRTVFTRDEHEMPPINEDNNEDDNEDKMDENSRACLNDLIRLTVGRQIDPDYLDRPHSPTDKPSADDPIEPPTL
jgi:hypothetical protein